MSTEIASGCQDVYKFHVYVILDYVVFYERVKVFYPVSLYFLHIIRI
jgi:hypothetical protein